MDFSGGKEYGAGWDVLKRRFALGSCDLELGARKRDRDMIRVRVHSLAAHAEARSALVFEHAHATVLQHYAEGARSNRRRVLRQRSARDAEGREQRQDLPPAQGMYAVVVESCHRYLHSRRNFT